MYVMPTDSPVVTHSKHGIIIAPALPSRRQLMVCGWGWLLTAWASAWSPAWGVSAVHIEHLHTTCDTCATGCICTVEVHGEEEEDRVECRVLYI